MSYANLFPEGGAYGPLYRNGAMDRVLVGGKQMPGEIVVACKIKMKLDPKHVIGKNGGLPRMLGQEGQEGTITIRLWTPEQFEVFQRDFGQIFDFLGYDPTAYAIEALALKMIRVKAIYFTGAGDWRWGQTRSGARCLEMVLEFAQWINDQRDKGASKTVKKKTRDLVKNDRTGSVDRRDATPPSQQENTFTVTTEN